MNRSRRNFIKAGVAMGVSAVMLDALVLERYLVELNEFDVYAGPQPKACIKLIQISDLHLKSVGYQHQEIAGKIKTIKPDLIVFTGDSVDRATSLGVLHEFLSLIDTDIPKVAILGNWEYWGGVDLQALMHLYARHNCTLLINQSKSYILKGRTIAITGVDDFVGGRANIELATAAYVKADAHVVLNHCPEYSEIIPFQISKSIPTNLILSGHTHGGQINIAGVIPFLPQGSGKYVKGWYKDSRKNLYVSKGIGTSMLPVRLGAKPEITLFNLHA